MTELNNNQDADNSDSGYPTAGRTEPPNIGHRQAGMTGTQKPEMPAAIWRKIFKFLSSVKLALVLLVAILACCVVGVTIYRGVEAGAKIFGTLWFNGLLVLLVFNVAFCFFPRMWRRKLTITSFGMILFHLSFVFMLVGVIYNSMFYFRGIIRLTEGETLPNGEPQSYDAADMGIFLGYRS